jgi:hypothetical protein
LINKIKMKYKIVAFAEFSQIKPSSSYLFKVSALNDLFLELFWPEEQSLTRILEKETLTTQEFISAHHTLTQFSTYYDDIKPLISVTSIAWNLFGLLALSMYAIYVSASAIDAKMQLDIDIKVDEIRESRGTNLEKQLAFEVLQRDVLEDYLAYTKSMGLITQDENSSFLKNWGDGLYNGFVSMNHHYPTAVSIAAPLIIAIPLLAKMRDVYMLTQAERTREKFDVLKEKNPNPKNKEDYFSNLKKSSSMSYTFSVSQLESIENFSDNCLLIGRENINLFLDNLKAAPQLLINNKEKKVDEFTQDKNRSSKKEKKRGASARNRAQTQEKKPTAWALKKHINDFLNIIPKTNGKSDEIRQILSLTKEVLVFVSILRKDFDAAYKDPQQKTKALSALGKGFVSRDLGQAGLKREPSLGKQMYCLKSVGKTTGDIRSLVGELMKEGLEVEDTKILFLSLHYSKNDERKIH